MTLDQPRRRAFGSRGAPSSNLGHGGYGARSNFTRSFQSRGRDRGRGQRESGTGRGRGRGKSKFEDSKIATSQPKEARVESGSEDNPEDVTELEDTSSSDDEEEESLSTSKSYSRLIQKFASEAPCAKRRKTSHSPHPDRTEDIENPLANTNDREDVHDPEEDNESEIENSDESDEENQCKDKNVSDPFSSHFDDSNCLKIKLVTETEWVTKKLVISEEYRAIVTVLKNGSNSYQFRPVADAGGLFLKKRLLDTFSKQRSSLDILEKNLASFMFNYQDILFCGRTPLNSEILRRLVCLHSVNHLLKVRDRVIKNNTKLARDEGSTELDLRDQGFTRPKVLFLLPTRESCVRIVKIIVSLCEPEQQENRKRFDDYYMENVEDSLENKGDDFRELFGGNNDDLFRLGLKFTRKTIKFFSQFYNSDIILASPLGLRMALEGKDGKKNDFDFLSSIELAIIEQADALLMQNWEHMEYIFDHMNLQPKETHGCDFSRVRSWYLDNNAKYFRQTITLTAFNTPEINALLFNHSKNLAGKAKIDPNYPGVIQDLGLKVKQTFSRLDSASFVADPDVRFTYFTTAIMSSLTRHSKENNGLLILIPSYLDFVRVRNYLLMSQATANLSFGSISEYSSVKEVARARSHFYSGRHNVLIYTERAHHYRRYRIRGVRKVVMYGLPENPIFYKEIVGGFLGRSVQEGQLMPGEGSVRVIYSKWDALKLERIVGLERVRSMIKERGDTFEFL
ncbi:hypothetical protein Golomagni_01774 [Golovinomyces magnicellulatus]|nr:hypothetical protein Golomagni_01774 [Golovinomyces magnicellulatus]